MGGITKVLLLLVIFLHYNAGFGFKLNKVSKRLDDIELKMLIARNERRNMHYSLENIEGLLNISLAQKASSGEIQNDIEIQLNEIKELLGTTKLAEISETFHMLTKGFSAEKKQSLRVRRRVSQIEDVLVLLSNNSETLARNMSAFFEDLRETNKALRETNENLRETNKTLREGNENLRETTEELRETNAYLREANRALRETNEDLREANKAMKETNENLRDTNKALRETNADLRETNKSVKEMHENTPNALLHVTDVLESMTTKMVNVVSSVLETTLNETMKEYSLGFRQEIKKIPCQVSQPKSCQDLLKCGHTESGVYSVFIGDQEIKMYCDQTTDGGGWTVFQRRQDGSVDFYQGWDEYKDGFGNLGGEFWLGNDKLHRLLSVKSRYELRVDLADFDNNKASAKYSRFMIGPENKNYILTAEGYSGDAGDSLAYHNGQPFSTKDRDNDKSSGSCSRTWSSAWWHNNCHHTNLNGLYSTNKQNSDCKNVAWWYWKSDCYPLKFSEMKFREHM